MNYYTYMKGKLLPVFKLAFKTITPWKKRAFDMKDEDYVNGWNDCIKEIYKNRVKWIKHFKLIKPL